MITQIDHIELIVNDLKKHEEFFTSLGFEVVKRSNHHGGSIEVQLPGPNQPVFELHEVLMEETIGINHIALRTENVEEVYKLFNEKGYKVIDPPRFSPYTGRTNMNGRDPDGWRYQIVDKKRVDPTK